MHKFRLILSLSLAMLLVSAGISMGEDKEEQLIQGLQMRYTQSYYNMGEPFDIPLNTTFSDFVDPSARENTEFEEMDEVRVGMVGLLSGPAMAYGQEMQNGVTMAIDEINAAGGYNGKPVKLFVRDDRGNMGLSGNQVVKLIYEDEVLGILGSVSSDTTHVGIRVALHSECVQLTSISTDPTITQIVIPWAFRCLADDWSQGRALAKMIYQDLGYRKIAAMEQDNRYGRMGITEFKRVSRRMAHPVRVSLKFNGSQPSFIQQCEVIKSYDPEAIVIWGLYNAVGKIAKQLRDIGVTCPIFGSDGIVSPAYFDYSEGAEEGNIVTLPYDPTKPDPVNMAFIERFKERYGYEPDSFAAHGYDAMYLMWRAIKIGGLNRGRIRDAMATTKNFHGVTGFISFDHMGNDTRPVTFAVIEDKQFKPVRDAEEVRQALKRHGYKVPDKPPESDQVSELK
ncbi:ABC transporter substrate-binding protein [Acidobacteriota bacterium]